MKVYMIGQTQVDLFTASKGESLSMPGKADGSAFQERYARNIEEGQDLIEFAGRLCYESWDLPNEATSHNSGYIRNIISQGHESVLEHVSVTFYVEGVSRNLTHELIRHRHLSFSELSQRFVNMEDAEMVVPPLWRELGEDWQQKDKVRFDRSLYDTYKVNVSTAQDYGATRKEAREAARVTIPGGVETKIVVSGNLRAWRDMLKKRLSPAADKEMQALAAEILSELQDQYPDVFADLA